MTGEYCGGYWISAIATISGNVSIMDQRWLGCEFAFSLAPIFRFSECVYAAIHGNGRIERDALHFEQTVRDHCSRRRERTGQLGLEFFGHRHNSERTRHTRRT